MTYENLPTPFNGLQHKIALLLDKGEMSVNAISRECGCTFHYVYEVKNSAKFRDWQRESGLQMLRGEGVKVALNTLLEIARDKKAPKTARVSAADKLLTHGYRINEAGELEKAPSQMTQSELRQRLEQLESIRSELSNRANPVQDGVVIDVDPIPSLDNLLD